MVLRILAKVELYPTLFYTAVAKVYDRSASDVSDKIFGNPYSVHLHYKVGHDDR